MEGVTAGTDTEAAPIFREVGATWYWLLAGPISAGIMLWIEKSNGNGWQISVPVFFLVMVSSFIALQVKAARIHTSVVLTPQTLRQGTETIKVSEIVKVYPEPDTRWRRRKTWNAGSPPARSASWSGCPRAAPASACGSPAAAPLRRGRADTVICATC